MLLRGDNLGARPVSAIEASKLTASVTDARQDVVRQLTQLAVGRLMQGTILSQMNDGSFIVRIKEADVAVRMNLPAGSQVGDTLELKLENTGPRPTFSFSRSSTPEATLSQAGRLIANILQTAQKEGQPPALVGKVPMLPSPSAPPAQIATALKDTLTYSGLFYESHVHQWASGERPLSQLMREPQARFHNQTLLAASLLRAASAPAHTMPIQQAHPTEGAAPSAVPPQPSLPASPAAQGNQPPLPPGTAMLANDPLPPADLPETAPASQAAAESGTDGTPKTSQLPSPANTTLPEKTTGLTQQNIPAGESQASKTNQSSQMPEPHSQRPAVLDSETARLISLQLDTLEQRRVAWQGELWPGQYMEWEVTEDTPHRGNAEAEEAERVWQSVVRFELPKLGNISAAITLQGQAVQVQIRAAREETASLLRTHGDDLASALDAAGSRLEQLSVKRDESA